MEPWVTAILGVLGGGVMAAFITAQTLQHLSDKGKRAVFLEDQLRKLYGPVYVLIAQSEKLLELHRRISEGYRKEYVEKEFSRDAGTVSVVAEAGNQVLQVANEYVEEVVRISGEIEKVINGGLEFIDPGDMDTFLIFFENRTRMKLERDEAGKNKLPLWVHEHLGTISFLNMEFVKQVKKRFLEKKQDLKNLLGG